MGFVPGSAPGTPGNMLGGPAFSTGLGDSGGSDATFDLEDDVPAPPGISLRQCVTSSVGYGSADPESAEPIRGVLDNSNVVFAPCVTLFNQDTLPGSLLVCVGVINATYIDHSGGGLLADLEPIFPVDAWPPVGTLAEPFTDPSGFLPCMGLSGGTDLGFFARAALTYRMNAPVVAAGRQFFGGLYSALWCNAFMCQMIMAEFQCVGVTQQRFSFHSPFLTAGAPLSITGRLPRDNPSFVISVTGSNPGNGAVPGPGFTLGPGSMLNSQWQYGAFDAQSSGYASPQWPAACPGLSGSFELGFEGASAYGSTSQGALVWNILSADTEPAPPPPAADLNQFLPNVWVNT
jgi:hypothetical protein